jgi:hypothetical protein
MPAKTKAKPENKPARIEIALTLEELDHVDDLVLGYPDVCKLCAAIHRKLMHARNNPVTTPKSRPSK